MQSLIIKIQKKKNKKIPPQNQVLPTVRTDFDWFKSVAE